jgi:predicted nucleic acid-binding protein
VIVFDSSAAVALISGIGPTRESLIERVQGEPEMAAPHLLDAEVARAFRRLARSGEVSPAEVPTFLEELVGLRISRYPHTALIPRVWELRDTVETYEAFYVALAEVMACPLVTSDGRLARAHGHGADIELFA